MHDNSDKLPYDEGYADGEEMAAKRIAELEATIADMEKEQQELVYDCRDRRIKIEKMQATIAELRESAREAVDAVRWLKPEHERAAIDALATLLEGE